jgi:hypothetical protein
MRGPRARILSWSISKESRYKRGGFDISSFDFTLSNWNIEWVVTEKCRKNEIYSKVISIPKTKTLQARAPVRLGDLHKARMADAKSSENEEIFFK